MIFRPKKPLPFIIFFGILIALGIIFLRPKQDDTAVTIVLSPHYDDAVLSLGGMLAMKEHPAVVATFFTGEPETATTTPWDAQSGFSDSHAAIEARVKENVDALKVLGATVKDYGYFDFQYRGSTTTDAELEQDIAEDIQALLAAYSDKTISVYAPAVFSPDLTHPDHQALHNAFLNVVDNYPKDNITFYFYEDYPYIEQFNKQSVISLKKNLENTTGKIFEEMQIPLTTRATWNKARSLKAYQSQVKAFAAVDRDILNASDAFTKNRCGSEMPCEVVYKLFRVIGDE
jgi:LmbE family N-acetylglucosaminyl deacetylase